MINKSKKKNQYQEETVVILEYIRQLAKSDGKDELSVIKFPLGVGGVVGGEIDKWKIIYEKRGSTNISTFKTLRDWE